jgi:hypothetical protein
MEEPELRVGGWKKEGGRRWLRRFFTITLVALLGLLIMGPTFINYNAAYVPNSSLYLANGMWNGPFDIDYSKEFVGHVKISSVSYETTNDQSGKLKVITMSSMISLEDFRLQDRVIEKTREEANKEGLTLGSKEKPKGNELTDENINLASGFRIYQWETDRYGGSDNLFFDDAFNDDGDILIKAFVWNQQTVNLFDDETMIFQYQTIICIIFGTDGTTINQATKMVEDIGK